MAYYYLDEFLQVHADADYLAAEDNARFAAGNYFPTAKAAAKAAADTLALWQSMRFDKE